MKGAPAVIDEAHVKVTGRATAKGFSKGVYFGIWRC